MPMLSNTAYQKRRLDEVVEFLPQKTYCSTYFCVDFTIENPLFSRVWKLE
jgi:hypothetical protein